MTDDERTLESLKLLRESSAWMVGVQTAIFGFLINLLSSGQLGLGSFLIKGAVMTFGLSIICAGVVLGAIPWILSRKPLVPVIRRASIANWPLINRISIGWVSGLQYLAFVLGLILLASAVILKQIG